MISFHSQSRKARYDGIVDRVSVIKVVKYLLQDYVRLAGKSGGGFLLTDIIVAHCGESSRFPKARIYGIF